MEQGIAAEGGWRERKYTLSLFLRSAGYSEFLELFI